MSQMQQNYSYIFIYVYVFIVGMCLSSFFMVVGYRIPRKETIMGRSHCEECQNELLWWHVLPLFSYLRLKGKCSFCSSKIGIINPILEVFIGLLFVISTFFLGVSSEMLVSFTLICLLFTISVSDLLYQIIPNKVLLPFLIVGIIERVFIPQNDFWWYPIAGFFVGFLPLFLLSLLKDGGVGGGDIKLFAVVGVFIGPIGVLISLFLSSVIAIIFHIITILVTEKRQKQIAFGPSIAIGSFIIYLFTSGQIEAMLKLFRR